MKTINEVEVPEELAYTDSEGRKRELEGCVLTTDKAGRFWLWSDQLQHNLAYKSNSLEDCLISSIGSLLFTIHLRDERIADLQRVNDLAQQFADQIKPDDPEELL